MIINCRFLTQPITGVQRFAIEICKELKRCHNDIVFVSPKKILHHNLAKELSVKKIGFFSGHLWEQVDLPLFVARRGLLLVSLCNTAPLFIRSQVITIHDLCFRIHPEWFSKSFSIYYNFLIPIIAKRSLHVLTVSETSKKEIVKELLIPYDKIAVIYNAVAPVFYEALASEASDNKLFKNRFVLTVSSHHPRKNFERLVKAFNLIEDRELNLYIIGNVNRHFVHNALGNGNDKRIQLLTEISDSELVRFYRNAELFVYPSLYEGFGIPIIEALSQQTQVCVSDIPVFREISGPCTIYFDPKSLLSIKNGIIEGLRQAKNNRDSFDLAGNIALKYSWKSGALKIIDIIKGKNRNVVL